MQLFKNFLLIFVSMLLPGAHLIADEFSGESPISSMDSTARDLDDKLIEAIINGDAKAVKALIAAGANVNAEVDRDAKVNAEDKYRTVLMLAAKRGNTDIVKALIAAGANVNVSKVLGDTALILAAEQDNADIVKILIAAGADVEATDLFGRTTLMEAARGGRGSYDQDNTINAVRALIAAGANVNASSSLTGDTALMEAAKSNNVNTVRVLIAAGADVNATDHCGKTASDLADQYGAFEAARILYVLENN